jgi:glycosyltransferase involved in cell wall biosynthesis
MGLNPVPKRLLFVVNAPEFFLSHRLPLALAARPAGYDVHVATAAGEAVLDIERQGFPHHVLPLSRSGRNPLSELGSLVAIWRLFRALRPSLVHLVTIKPVLYGGLMARLAGVPGVVAAISGLGTVFMSDGSTRRLVQGLYRLALGHPNSAVIFQNADDRDALRRIGAVRADQVRLVRGSGVALTDYHYLPEPEGVPVVTMAARLLRDKGVAEFVAAAGMLHERGVEAKFRLVGSQDPGNPTSITDAELALWKSQGDVCFPGFRTDIARQYAESNVVCLPSYYREGLPKNLVEAAACGRAVVTTDVPGCRDAIVPGESGILVPPRNAEALANAIQALLSDPVRRRGMGKAGRALAEKEFAIEKIVAAHLAIYRELESS